MEKENENSKKTIKELENKIKVEKTNYTEFKCSLKSLEKELIDKTAAIKAVKSDSIELSGS